MVPTAPYTGSPADTTGGWVPCPLLGWEELYTALAPGEELTRQRARTMKKHQRMSGGVKVYIHGDRGLNGSSSYHSVLCLWAERARSRGFDADAERLNASANELEDRFADEIRNFLAHRPFEDLVETKFFWALAGETSRKLAESAAWQEAMFAVAKVAEAGPAIAHLQGCAFDGTNRHVDLPRELLARNNLDVGAHVFVYSYLLGRQAMVEVQPAVPVPLWTTNYDFALNSYFCDEQVLNQHLVPSARSGESAGTDLVHVKPHGDWLGTGHGRPVGAGVVSEPTTPAERYERGAGSRIDATQVAQAREAARRAGVTARPLRPAG